MTEKLIFGDIHGRASQVEVLARRAPHAEPISVGDMVDRGPDARRVLEFFRAHGRAIKGNHEHMMLDAYYHEHYEKGYVEWLTHGQSFYYQPTKTWMCNGGVATLASFAPPNIMEPINAWYALGDDRAALDIKYTQRVIHDYIPEDLMEWVDSLPYYIKEDGLLITHAPKNPTQSLEQCCDLGENGFDPKCDRSILWNRGRTRFIDGLFQIHGHMSTRNPNWLRHKIHGTYGINLDINKSGMTTCLHFPHTELLQEDYQK